MIRRKKLKNIEDTNSYVIREEDESFVARSNDIRFKDLVANGETPIQALGNLISKIKEEEERLDRLEKYEIEYHLGAPYASNYLNCVICDKPAVRTATMNGSITNLKTGHKTGFTEANHKVGFCKEHGVIRKTVDPSLLGKGKGRVK